MDLVQSILKRFPSMTENQITIRDNGQGPFIYEWNETEPQPTMEEVKNWNAEDKANYVPPLSPAEELQALKKQQELMQAALDDVIFSGGGI